MIYGTRGVVEWLIKHEAKRVLYQTRDHSPSAISHVEHDLPILSGLKYMPRLTRSSCNAKPSLRMSACFMRIKARSI